MQNTENLHRISYGIRQACEATCLGRSFLYQEIAEGNLPAFKVGARTLIAASDLEAWLRAYRNKSV